MENEPVYVVRRCPGYHMTTQYEFELLKDGKPIWPSYDREWLITKAILLKMEDKS